MQLNTTFYRDVSNYAYLFFYEIIGMHWSVVAWVIAPQAQFFETAKDRSVSMESPLKQVVTGPKPDHVLSSNARYETILVSRSGSPDVRFWPDRVRPSVSVSVKTAHLLPQHSEGKDLGALVNRLKSQETDPPHEIILLLRLRRKPASRVHSSF